VSAAVEARGLAFAYGPAGRRPAATFALADVSFAAAPGEVLGVVGPNSAGKTTLIRLLTRVLTPARGQVLLDGVPLEHLPRWAAARRVAVVAQELPGNLPFTVEQLVLMGRLPHAPRRFFESAADRRAAGAAMAMTGVAHLAAVPVARLSGGERQRAVLARALAQEPGLLVLDEPTAHLDLRYQAECVALLRRVNRERGTTVILVSHDLNLAAEVSDRLLLLAGGRVVRIGPPADVLEPELLSRVYGCEIVVTPSPAGRPWVQVVWPEAPSRVPSDERR
jgi:iron complex transport system ATP-binding protein